MNTRKYVLCFLPLCFLAARNLSAQLQPQEPDPLERIRDAAKNNVQACSATGETLCEQVAPKIIANSEGDSPLARNLQRLDELAKAERSSTEWAIAALQDANVNVHTERYPANSTQLGPEPHEEVDVVAEIRGREKPNEWVLLGAYLASPAPGQQGAYNAASVIEAARAIQLTGIRPRRSIRFVIFVPGDEGGSFHYTRAHHDELDHLSSVIILSAAANPVTGLILNGRHDIESGVREALDPISVMGVTHHSFDAPRDYYSLGFILEGIPTLLTPPVEQNHLVSTAKIVTGDSDEKKVIGDLKRNIAIAAVTAFDIAERSKPIGPRQTRAEIESLLKTTGLEQYIKGSVKNFWESEQHGRIP